MSTIGIVRDEAVDVIYALEGACLPHDHAQSLQTALCGLFEWLAQDAIAAILPLKLVAGADGNDMLPRRAQLVLRVLRSRVPDTLAVAGRSVIVDGNPLRIERPHVRELRPHATLYAYKVASCGHGELAFMSGVQEELARLSIGGERVCGQRGQLSVSGKMVETFSLMLHGLPPEQSLRVQQFGLGPHRLLGCGVFVPHKSAAAV